MNDYNIIIMFACTASLFYIYINIYMYIFIRLLILKVKNSFNMLKVKKMEQNTTSSPAKK